MKRNVIVSLVLMICLQANLSLTNAQTHVGREHILFDDNWLFHKGDLRIDRAVKAGEYGGLTDEDKNAGGDNVPNIAYNDRDKAARFIPEQWESVSLPHDWAVEEDFINDKSKVIDGAPQGLASHGFLPVGIGFYRKKFIIPASDSGRKISVTFDGVFRDCQVWVNGHFMGTHVSGYLPFSYDLTDVLRYGQATNVILVKVDASQYEGWWYEGCGIYRHVWLDKTDPLHVARFGTFITTPHIDSLAAKVNIQTTIENESCKNKSIIVVSRIIDQNDIVVDTKTSNLLIKAFGKLTVNQLGAIKRPNLWSPERPCLYKVLTEIRSNGIIADTYKTNFGVRTVEVRKDGFYLNGQLYQIKGTANHQDFAGVGVAVPDKINAYRIKLLKEMGSNAYRSAHNPPTPELLDECDRQGMLVLDENRMLASTTQGREDLKTLIMRDRNHPSVFMWCLENEETIEGTPAGKRILQSLYNLAKGMDSTRQITAAINHGWDKAGYGDVLDVVGYNYGQRNAQYVKDKVRYPERKMIVTETASFVSTRGEYSDDQARCYVSNMGNGVGWGMLPGKDWEQVVKYPYLCGEFAWTGFDYRGEPTPFYRWPTVTSHFGIMDLCGFPKDGYYAYKAAWTNEYVLHIFPHWNWPDMVGKKIKIMGYTNCDEVELIVNSKSLGRKKVKPFERVEWEAVYSPGIVKARGYKNGKLVIEKIIETTGPPAEVVLSKDTDVYKADGRDVAIINVAVQDKKGRVVPTAGELVRFQVEGDAKIIGTGNGDPSSHEHDKADQRAAFNGYCQVLVQMGHTPGMIKVKAESAGLISGEIRLMVR